MDKSSTFLDSCHPADILEMQKYGKTSGVLTAHDWYRGADLSVAKELYIIRSEKEARQLIPQLNGEKVFYRPDNQSGKEIAMRGDYCAPEMLPKVISCLKKEDRKAALMCRTTLGDVSRLKSLGGCNINITKNGILVGVVGKGFDTGALTRGCTGEHRTWFIPEHRIDFDVGKVPFFDSFPGPGSSHDAYKTSRDVWSRFLINKGYNANDVEKAIPKKYIGLDASLKQDIQSIIRIAMRHWEGRSMTIQTNLLKVNGQSRALVDEVNNHRRLFNQYSR